MPDVDYRCVLAALDRVRDYPSVMRVFGQRGFQAWQLVKSKRVKKYVFLPSGRVQWIVVGDGRDYLIYDVVGYCHCVDFYQAVMRGEAFACKHLVAWKMAVNFNLFETILEDDKNYHVRLEEWKKI